MIQRLLIAAIVFSLPSMASATGLYECEATDQSKWLSETELTAMLTEAGWEVRRMKPDGGCWEAYGTTPDGDRVEGYFDPVTGEQLLLSQRGRILFRADD